MFWPLFGPTEGDVWLLSHSPDLRYCKRGRNNMCSLTLAVETVAAVSGMYIQEMYTVHVWHKLVGLIGILIHVHNHKGSLFMYQLLT